MMVVDRSIDRKKKNTTPHHPRAAQRPPLSRAHARAHARLHPLQPRAMGAAPAYALLAVGPPLAAALALLGRRPFYVLVGLAR